MVVYITFSLEKQPFLLYMNLVTFIHVFVTGLLSYTLLRVFCEPVLLQNAIAFLLSGMVTMNREPHSPQPTNLVLNAVEIVKPLKSNIFEAQLLRRLSLPYIPLRLKLKSATVS